MRYLRQTFPTQEPNDTGWGKARVNFKRIPKGCQDIHQEMTALSIEHRGRRLIFFPVRFLFLNLLILVPFLVTNELKTHGEIFILSIKAILFGENCFKDFNAEFLFGALNRFNGLKSL